jgi:SAM-dependent methyltransferase
MDVLEVRQLAGAFQKSRILLTAFELDVFTLIGKHGLSAEIIAGKLNLNKNATERLLNALVAMQLLSKEEAVFHNTEGSLKFLSKDSTAYMAGLMHTNHLWNTWSHLTEVVRTGDVAHDETINDRGEAWLEAFISAMHDRGKNAAPALISKIDLRQVESVLDVGGGSGCFCMAFLDRKPGLKAVVFDLPNVLPISQKIVEREGYSGRIDHHSGDYMTDELPGGFDLVFLSAIIHSNSFESNQLLVNKCYKSLNPKGKLVIQDWIMNDARTEPAQGAIFAINMLVGVEGGDCYTETEVRIWMTNAGFVNISKEQIDTDKAQMTGIRPS